MSDVNPQLNVLSVEHLRTTQVEPGDVLVVTVQGYASRDLCDRISDVLREAFGEDQKILLMEAGAQLGILRPIAPGGT